MGTQKGPASISPSLPKGFSPSHTHKPRNESCCAHHSRSGWTPPRTPAAHGLEARGGCRVTSGKRGAALLLTPAPPFRQGQPLTCPHPRFFPGVVLPPQGTLRHVWGHPWSSRLGCSWHRVGTARDAAPPHTVPWTAPHREYDPPSIQFSFEMLYICSSSCRYFEKPCSGRTPSRCGGPRGR